MTETQGEARTEILGRVRAALHDAEPAGQIPPAPRIPAAEHTAVVDLFAERVEDYRAIVERCGPGELAARVAAALPGGPTVVPPGLALDVPHAVIDTPEQPLSAAELDRVGAVVTRARVGIAETGTIVLDHTEDQGRRAISLVPDVHVCIVRADQVVPDVPDAVTLLEPGVKEGRALTWISGPSATSDIELDRVEGVHGPRTLHVLLVSG